MAAKLLGWRQRFGLIRHSSRLGSKIAFRAGSSSKSASFAVLARSDEVGVGTVLKRCSLISLAICMIVTPLALARRPDESIKAEIRFFVDSTMVHSSYGENEDVYLVEMTANRGGSEAVFARLIDRYPPSGAPIPFEALISKKTTIFRVRRDLRCDIAYRDLVLRTRPGDPLSILPERLGFKPEMSTPFDPGDVLPCYRVVRK